MLKCIHIEVYFNICNILQVIPHKKFGSRQEFEAEINKNLLKNDIDIICLAGFMRILTEKFVIAWRGKMLNIHPSLLPAFKGMDAQKQAFEARVKITGCTVHFVSVSGQYFFSNL